MKSLIFIACIILGGFTFSLLKIDEKIISGKLIQKVPVLKNIFINKEDDSKTGTQKSSKQEIPADTNIKGLCRQKAKLKTNKLTVIFDGEIMKSGIPSWGKNPGEIILF